MSNEQIGSYIWFLLYLFITDPYNFVTYKSYNYRSCARQRTKKNMKVSKRGREAGGYLPIVQGSNLGRYALTPY